jgi:hypothetical protein
MHLDFNVGSLSIQSNVVAGSVLLDYDSVNPEELRNYVTQVDIVCRSFAGVVNRVRILKFVHYVLILCGETRFKLLERHDLVARLGMSWRSKLDNFE